MSAELQVCAYREAKGARVRKRFLLGDPCDTQVSLLTCCWFLFRSHCPLNSLPYLTPRLGFRICKMGAMVILLIYLPVHL